MQRNRWSSDDIARRFLQYGYVVPANFKHKTVRTPVHVYNEVTNKKEWLSVAQLNHGVASGKIVEVDPFIDWLYSQSGPMIRNSSSLDDYVENFPFDRFREESPIIQQRTFDLAKRLKERTERYQNIKVRRTNDPDDDRVALYAIIDVLYSISEKDMDNYHVVFKVSTGNSEMNPDVYWYINNSTVSRLKNIIDHIYYGADKQKYGTSFEILDFNLQAWDTLEVLFEPRKSKPNRLENPAQERARRQGGMWGFLNTSPGIDLSRYGIFSQWNKDNYEYGCFVQAMENSGVLSPAEIAQLKTMVITRHFPCDQIRFICEKFHIQINLYQYDPYTKKTSTSTYGNNKDRLIKLLLCLNHYMINEPVNINRFYMKNWERIEAHQKVNKDRKFTVCALGDTAHYRPFQMQIREVIDWFFTNNWWKPLTFLQLQELRLQEMHLGFEDLEYPDWAVQEITPKTIVPSPKPVVWCTEEELVAKSEGKDTKWKSTVSSTESDGKIYKNKQLMIPFESTEEDMVRWKEIMKKEFDIEVDAFISLAQIGKQLMSIYKCYEGVYRLSGVPALFLAQCRPKIVIGPADGHPQHIKGDLVQLDRNGSYTSVYKSFEGIPKGKPKIMTELIQDVDYYYIYVNVHSFQCKQDKDPYPLITEEGPQFFSKTIWDLVMEHYDIEYDFISGYYFDEGFNKNIISLADKLWNLRQELKSNHDPLEKCIKFILNSLWGASIPSKSFTESITLPKSKSEKFRNWYNDFLYNSTPGKTTVKFQIIQPWKLTFSIPQFGVNVVCASRKFMSHFYYNYDVFYSNTDCILTYADKIPEEFIGEDVGQFHIEHAGIREVLILSAKKWIYIGDDGEVIAKATMKKFDSDEDLKRYFFGAFIKIGDEFSSS